MREATPGFIADQEKTKFLKTRNKAGKQIGTRKKQEQNNEKITFCLNCITKLLLFTFLRLKTKNFLGLRPRYKRRYVGTAK